MSSHIELNGKRYDALTGTLLGDVSAARAKSKSPQGHSVDGIVTSTPAKKPTAHPHQAAPTRHATPTQKRIMDVSRPGQHHVAHHKPQHAKTLMRRVVHKPSDSLKRHVKLQTHTGLLAATPTTIVLPKLSFSSVDPERLKRAERVAKSRLVRRFAPFQPTRVMAATSATATVSAPTVSIPAPQRLSPPTTKPRVAKGPHSMDIFEKALAHANSHEQPAVKPKKHAPSRKRRLGVGRRAVSTTAIVAAILLVAGFIGLQNKANITMRVASSKAGFHATLPGYKPSGFAVGKFSYSPGIVAIKFTSNSDNRNFSVIQKASNWDSETLLNDYVAVNSGSYQAFQDNGRTVYVYGNNDATWVNNGIWYQISDNGSLSTNQVLQLAQSM